MQPFKHIPKRVKIEFVYFIVLWLNAVPGENGHLIDVLATRAVGEMEIRLQKSIARSYPGLTVMLTMNPSH